MTIEPTTTSLAALQEQTVASSSASSSSSSSTSVSFQQVLAADAGAEPVPELTALQKLFRCPTYPPAANSAALELGATTSETETGNPAAPAEPLDPSPAAPWPTTAIQPYPTPALAGEAKSAVLAALEREGIDSSAVKISYWEELVTYPGGSYTNKNITVQTASGRKIDLDAAYMARCPWLAASAVQELDQVVT